MTPQFLTEVWQRSRCLHDQATVEKALDRMADQISEALGESNPILLCILHGGLIVAGKLAVRLNFPLQLDYLHATRYRGSTRGDELHWKALPTLPLAGRVVLLVDDILDEGETLVRVKEFCRRQGAEAVLTAVLVDKLHDRKAAGSGADFVGLEAADYYLFGYGMDYRGYLRNAPGIYAIDESDRLAGESSGDLHQSGESGQ